MSKLTTLKPYEIEALHFLSRGPDRITTISDDGTFAAAVVFLELGKRGLVHIDNEDGMLVTLSEAGRLALNEEPDHGRP